MISSISLSKHFNGKVSLRIIFFWKRIIAVRDSRKQPSEKEVCVLFWCLIKWLFIAILREAIPFPLWENTAADDAGSSSIRCAPVKRKKSSENERKRNLDIKDALKTLAASMPYVKRDLSRIRTLRLAKEYIEHMRRILEGELVRSLNYLKRKINYAHSCRSIASIQDDCGHWRWTTLRRWST